MLKMKETRKIFADNLKELAIREQWFTLATNEQYEEWFSILGDGEYTLEKIEALARMVRKYSDINPSECTVVGIAHMICRYCVFSFFEFERE